MDTTNNNMLNGTVDGTEDRLHVAIIGGGIVGLVTALGLLNRNIPVRVYEQARSLREIGAGVAFTTNAQRCMELIDPKVLRAMKAVSTANPSEYYTYVDGYNSQSDDLNDTSEKELFKLYAGTTGFDGCHRAHFLDQLAKLLPDGVVHFQKRLSSLEEEAEAVKMFFEDGTTEITDAVIGCDGIKSRVRQLLFGVDNPASFASYTHKVAYRGLVQMDEAEAALGKDKAHNQCMHMGPRAHVLNFPIAQHTLMNVVAFATDDNDWAHEKLTAPATRREVMEVFKDWAPAVKAIASLLEDSLDKWAIFDCHDNPLPSFSSGRVCLAGDAAHAASPHHGAGAGFGVEDALALATVLGQVKQSLLEGGLIPRKKSFAVTAAFRAYDAVRRERGQWLVKSSRHICDTYEWADPKCGDDPGKCLEEIEWRAHKIWYFDYEGMIKDARAEYENFSST
ncbi:FAD/NAD(P)-binding domain-containing protein, partial [Aureobasidium melanogenum]